MRRELNWKIITEKYLFSLFTEHHSDDLKCHKAGLTPPSTHLSWRVLLRGWVGVQDQHPPQHGWEACGCILMRGGGAEWKSRQSDVEEERERVGVKKKKQKREWEGKQLLPSPFPVQPLLLAFSQRAHKHTHARIHWFGVVGHINRTTKRRTGGAHTLQPGQHHISPASSVRDERTELLSHICWELKRQSDWRWPSQKR